MTEGQFRERCWAKLCSPEAAARLVRSGDTVYIGTCSSVALALCGALAQRAQDLEDVTISCSQIIPPLEAMNGSAAGPFRVLSYFMGPQERLMQSHGLADYTSVHLSQIKLWCEFTAKPDVVFLEVSPPDEQGYMSFGASGVALHDHLCQNARTVVLQINRNTPYVFGQQNLIVNCQVKCNRESKKIS